MKAPLDTSVIRYGPVQSRVGRLGVEDGALAVPDRIGLEYRPLQMRRQRPKLIALFELDPVEVHHERLGVDRVDPGDPPVQLGVAHAALGGCPPGR